MSDWNVNDPRVAAISAIRDRENAECQHNDWMTFGKKLVVCAGCEVDASEIVGKLRQQLEQAEAKADLFRQACEDLLDDRPIEQAFILRKQAEAVAFVLDKLVEDQPKVSANVTGVINYYAQRLRQQADEAERAGGEK